MTDTPALAATPDATALRLTGDAAEAFNALLNKTLHETGISRETLAESGDTLDFMETASALGTEELRVLASRLSVQHDENSTRSNRKTLSGTCGIFSGFTGAIVGIMVFPAAAGTGGLALAPLAPALLSALLGALGAGGMVWGATEINKADKATTATTTAYRRYTATNNLLGLSPHERKTVSEGLTQMKATHKKLATLGL